MFGVLDARLRQPLSRTRHERGGAAARSTHYRPSLLPRIAVPLLDVSHWRRDLKLQEQHLVLQFRSAHSQLTSLSLSPRIRGLLLLNLICAICGRHVLLRSCRISGQYLKAPQNRGLGPALADGCLRARATRGEAAPAAWFGFLFRMRGGTPDSAFASSFFSSSSFSSSYFFLLTARWRW